MRIDCKFEGLKELIEQKQGAMFLERDNSDVMNVEVPDGLDITGQTEFSYSDGMTGTVGDVMLVVDTQGYDVEEVASTDGSGNRAVIPLLKPKAKRPASLRTETVPHPYRTRTDRKSILQGNRRLTSRRPPKTAREISVGCACDLRGISVGQFLQKRVGLFSNGGVEPRASVSPITAFSGGIAL